MSSAGQASGPPIELSCGPGCPGTGCNRTAVLAWPASSGKTDRTSNGRGGVAGAFNMAASAAEMWPRRPKQPAGQGFSWSRAASYDPRPAQHRPGSDPAPVGPQLVAIAPGGGEAAASHAATPPARPGRYGRACVVASQSCRRLSCSVACLRPRASDQDDQAAKTGWRTARTMTPSLSARPGSHCEPVFRDALGLVRGRRAGAWNMGRSPGASTRTNSSAGIDAMGSRCTT